MTNPQYRCGVCKNRYKTEPDKRKNLMDAMACNYIAEKPRHNYKPEHNNSENPTVKYKNCIGNHFYAKWSGIINFYEKYNSGILPFSGGFMEQPAKFVEVMELVHNLIVEKQEIEKRQIELKSRNRLGGRK